MKNKTEFFDSNALEEQEQCPVGYKSPKKVNNSISSVTTHKFIIYTLSYFFIYLAIYIPSWLKLKGKPALLDLSTSRLSIDIVISNEDLLIIALLLSALFYIPIFIASKKMFDYFLPTVKRFTFINLVKYYSYISLIMIFISFLVAGNIEWILSNYNTSWFETVIKYFFIWVFFNFIVLISPSRK